MSITRVSFTILACLAIAAAGCSRSRQNQAARNRPLIEAYQLIDRHRTDEAIIYLEDLLESDPENAEYLVALASAYAQKAGVRIQSFIPLIKVTKEKVGNAKWDIDKDHEVGKRIDSTLTSLARILTKYAHIGRVYSVIPPVAPENRPFLIKAIDIMDGLKSPAQADAIYRAALKAVLFKHDLGERLIGPAFTEKGQKENNCKIDFVELSDATVNLGRLLIDIYADMAIAQPSKAARHKKSSADIANLVSNLTLATTSLMVLDEGSQVFLQSNLLENDFGKIIRCGGSAD